MHIFRRFLFFLLLLAGLLACPVSSWANVHFKTPSSVPWGDTFLVDITSDLSLKNARLVWQNKTIPLQVDRTDKGYKAVAILGTDVKYSEPGKKELVFKATIGGIASSLKRSVHIVSKKFTEQHLTVAKKMVTPSTKSLDRIREESKTMSKALATLTPERYWSIPFIRPVAGGVSSEYGLRRFFNEQPRSPHRGVDLRGAEGTPIKATNAGRIILTGDFYFGGNTVFLDHGQGLISMYCHLSKIDVHQGMMVNKGDIVGLVGKTGRVTGPHLHFSIFSANQSANPMPLFSKRFGQEK